MYEEIEDAFVARLIDYVGTTNASIEVLPDNTQVLKAPGAKAIIYVVISQCGNSEDTDTATVATTMDVHVEVSVRSSARRGAGGSFSLEQLCREALSGFNMTAGGCIDPVKYIGSKMHRSDENTVEGISLIFNAKVVIFDANYSEGVQYGNLAQVNFNKEFL